MWSNQTQSEVPGTSSARRLESPAVTSNTMPVARPVSPAVRPVTCLGATLEFTGQISGQEDLQIDGKVEGPISLRGYRLLVGSTGQLNSEITANEIVVHGKVTGNLRAHERVDIKSGGSVAGDIITARISIEDGADFRGHAEIERSKAHSAQHSE